MRIYYKYQHNITYIIEFPYICSKYNTPMIEDILKRSCRDHVFFGYVYRAIANEGVTKYEAIKKYKEEFNDLRGIENLYNKYNECFKSIEIIKSI